MYNFIKDVCNSMNEKANVNWKKKLVIEFNNKFDELINCWIVIAFNRKREIVEHEKSNFWRNIEIEIDECQWCKNEVWFLYS